ncbi:unnamed protein product [[Candida] boidinii]|nr:unnamed protein product [[Candida] boidinii]
MNHHNIGSSSNTDDFQAQPINIGMGRNNSIYQNPRLRRESIAHSQGMGGVSWGSVTIGSWLKDEVLLLNSQLNINNNNNNINNAATNNNLNANATTNNTNLNSNAARRLSSVFGTSHKDSTYSPFFGASTHHTQSHLNPNNNNNSSSNNNHSNSISISNNNLNIMNSNNHISNHNLMAGDSISLAMSPSFNNTGGYLADLEANYFKDYSCCGQSLQEQDQSITPWILYQQTRCF